MTAKFQFGNVVVVDRDQIGVIVKSWGTTSAGYSHDVYVRSYNGVSTYLEIEIKHFVYSKELTEEEENFYD